MLHYEFSRNLKVYNLLSPTHVRCQIFDRMVKSAKTFQEWVVVYEIANQKSSISKLAMQKIQESKDVEAPHESIVFVLKDMGEIYQDELFEKMMAKDLCFDARLFILAFARKDSEIYSRVYAETLNEICDGDTEWLDKSISNKMDDVMEKFIQNHRTQKDLEYVIEILDKYQDFTSYQQAEKLLSNIIND